LTPLGGWTGTELSVDFEATFNVGSVSFHLSNAPTHGVLLTVGPESPMRNNQDFSTACNDSSCAWTLEPVPFIRNLVVAASSSPSQDFTVYQMRAELQQYQPIDGEWVYVGEWSICSNGCGEGFQTKQMVCTAPRFGGLPCTDINGTLTKTSFATRGCRGSTDCGTNWAVMAVIGWWQLLLVVVFTTRKIYGFAKSKSLDAAQARARPRFGSDLDEFDQLDDFRELEQSLRSGSYHQGQVEDYGETDREESDQGGFSAQQDESLSSRRGVTLQLE
jgi:hypothetical protein